MHVSASTEESARELAWKVDRGLEALLREEAEGAWDRLPCAHVVNLAAGRRDISYKGSDMSVKDSGHPHEGQH
jgi:hypothetical protein